MRLGRELHLTYCTNVHRGEGWEEHFSALAGHLPRLRSRLPAVDRFGLGLRLSHRAATELARPAATASFRRWLDRQGLYLFSINGFPYGEFHGPLVKEQVFAPDWRSPARLDYSVTLARLLAALLPPGVTGTLSTLPLSYKPWIGEGGRRAAIGRCIEGIAALAGELFRLRARSGREIVLAIEPEPNGLIETVEEFIDFMARLLDEGREPLRRGLGISPAEAEGALRRHVGICYDTCHQAVEFEEVGPALRRLSGAGLRLAKVQLSNALAWPAPASPSARDAGVAALAPLAASPYLHQVLARGEDGQIRFRGDLPAALAAGRDLEGEWRIHCHVPIYSGVWHGIGTTRQAVSETLASLAANGWHPHLEIETYTWLNLPEPPADLARAIADEYLWALEEWERVRPASRAPDA